MKVVFVLFDSLNRRALSCYAPPGTVRATPSFDRLSKRGVVFDRHFVGSLPCMPARRDIQTGRLNFLHRGWGPLEPFDRSVASMLRDQGTYTHLITDHYHYFEDGGFTFHGRYSSWEFIRGQEKDKWQSTMNANVDRYRERFDDAQHDFSPDINSKLPYFVNREFLEASGDFPLTQCFDSANRFLDAHHANDNWLLHLECFDPHEPFFAPERFMESGAAAIGGKIFDWPSYGRADIDPALIAQLRANYLGLVAACDHHLGEMLDRFDRLDLWRDTCLIVSTDHGLLLGEKEYLGKNRPPFFNEVAHIPLIVCAPDVAPGRTGALTQTTDLMPTMLELFGIGVPDEVTGSSLVPILDDTTATLHPEGCLYGQFGAAINYTDGRYTYFLYPREPFEANLYQYTLMPTHMRTFFEAKEFEGAKVASLPFSQGFPVWRLPVRKDAAANMTRRYPLLGARTVLYDMQRDPQQSTPIDDSVVEARIRRSIVSLLRAHDAPDEVYARYALDAEAMAA
ncbi:MAG: sulfatase [Betaproteobacteria bacterium]